MSFTHLAPHVDPRSPDFPIQEVGVGGQHEINTTSPFGVALMTAEGYTRRFRRPMFSDSAREVFPDLPSTHPSFRRVCSDLVEIAGDWKAGPHSDTDGRAKPPFTSGDLSRLYTAAGLPADPGPLPILGSNHERKLRGLTLGWKSPRDRALAQEVLAYLVHPVADTLRWSKKSGVGFPFFVSGTEGIGVRRKIAQTWAKEGPQLLSLFLGGRLKELRDTKQMVIARCTTARLQADRASLENGMLVGREREVHGRKYLLSHAADADIIKSNKSIPGIQATRNRGRAAYDTGAWGNVLLNALVAPFLKGLYTIAPKVYHVQDYSRQEKLWREAAPGLDWFSFDVSRMDSTVPLWFFAEALDAMRPYANEEVLQFGWLHYLAPMLARDPAVGKTNHIWTGNPLDLRTFVNDGSLPSGTPFNSWLGKLYCSVAFILELDHFYGDALGRVEDIFSWGKYHGLCWQNLSDNTIAALEPRADGAHFRAHLETVSDPYVDLDFDEVCTFGGGVFGRADDGTTKVLPNLWSYLVNWYVPERSILQRVGTQVFRSPFRPYPKEGFALRKLVYALHPNFGEVERRVDQVWLDNGLLVPDSLMARVPGDLVSFRHDSATVRALIDPSRIFWAPDADQIDPTLLKDELSRASREETEALWALCFNHSTSQELSRELRSILTDMDRR